ncbi:MAG: type IV pilus twitching motility protein PilT [Lachnospiraceae bacterium]|nr:type IV pilus twitching motility protein PilT [Lachnospiraceae bacterium]MBR2995828.1 type IV pilus twitching motility protein PilT [Lachnospiraceae bacterium]
MLAKERGASDLHINVGSRPAMRIHNELVRMEDQERLTPDDTKELLFSLMNDSQVEKLQQTGECDFSFGRPQIGRFRVNVYRQRGTYAAAIRIMHTEVPKPEEIGLPQSIIQLTRKRSGLVLVTGPTGCGKSTTLASLIQRINDTRNAHILTLEDPIEYLYRHNLSIVDQREIGLDTESFAAALRAALREDPDVILVGEMRDLETISIAVTAAETGHLVFSTLHTIGAAPTIDRIIDVFPEGQKEQIRVQLSSVLESVISQRLVERADGQGRVALFEIMHVNNAVRNLIRDNKIFQIPGIIQTSSKQGMITMDESLQLAYNKGIISKETLLYYASDPLRARIQ